MTMFTVRLFNNGSDPVQTVTRQVPVGALIQLGVLADPPTSTASSLKPAVIFEVPDGETPTELRTFKIVKDGVPIVGGVDVNQRIGSYFSDLYSEHAWHIFLVR